jgi:excisionase family DNA binding protein
MEKATLSVQETAEYIGIGRNKAYELVSSGILPAIKIGKQYRIPKVSLDTWLVQQTRINPA